MRIYEELSLCNNRVYDVKPVLTQWPTADTTNGAFRYRVVDNTGGNRTYKLELYYDSAWREVASSTPSDPQSGNFKLKSGVTATGSASPGTIDVSVNNSGGNGSTVAFGMNSGKLRVANGTETNSDFVEVDVLGNIAEGMVFFSEFTNEDPTTPNIYLGEIYVTVTNPLKSSEIVVNVYEQNSYKASSNGQELKCWDKVGCEVRIKHASENCNVLLHLRGLSTGSASKFKMVAVGSPGTISSAGASATEHPSANDRSNSDNTTKQATNPDYKVTI